MNLDIKKGAILALVIISTFLLGSIVTAVPTDGNENSLDALWERLFGVEEEVEEIADEVTLMSSNLDLLERIHDLETRMAVLENCGCEETNGFPEPDYDSNWVSIGKAVSLTLTHDLNSDNYFVYLVGKYDTVGGDSITPTIGPGNFHTWEMGGDWFYDDIYGTSKKYGVYYEAYPNTITIHRAASDPYSDYVRVQIWRLS